MSEKPRYISARDAAKELGVHISTLRLWAIKGRIDVLCTPGRRYLYNVESFMVKAKAATADKMARELVKLEKRERALTETRQKTRLAKIEERRKLAEDQKRLI